MSISIFTLDSNIRQGLIGAECPNNEHGAKRPPPQSIPDTTDHFSLISLEQDYRRGAGVGRKLGLTKRYASGARTARAARTPQYDVICARDEEPESGEVSPSDLGGL
jgi:hypothetical protein